MRMGIKRNRDERDSTASEKNDITEDEAALYDRQIRLWGLESQKRLRNTNVLIVGLSGLGAEVAKNIVLAGVKAVTLMDKKEIVSNDFASNFLLAGSEVGKNRAEGSKTNLKQLNPNVEVDCETGSIQDKKEDFFRKFNVVVATDTDLSDLMMLDKTCRELKIYFLCGDTWGYHGYCFMDLGAFTYLPPPVIVGGTIADEPPKAKKRKNDALVTMSFGSLEKALSVKSGKAGVALHKKMSKVFFLFHLLMKFREEKKRFPLPQNQQEDLESLIALRKPVMEKLGFDEDKIKDDDLKCIFGEISPVCAIVGGVLSQEVIKAICADQDPLRNFFLFDGDLNLGVVESIG